MDTFSIQVQDLGTIHTLRIGHDNGGMGAAWFLSHVSVQCDATNSTWFFPCGKWYLPRPLPALPLASPSLINHYFVRFSQSMGDKLIERDIPASDSLVQTKYTVTVCTGDVANAGTDANVFITIFGDKVCVIPCGYLWYSPSTGKQWS